MSDIKQLASYNNKSFILSSRTASSQPHLQREAPVPAVILSRSRPEDGIPTYNLRLGSVEVPNVSLLELFDYVSPFDLEVFENQVFEEERQAKVTRDQTKKATRIVNRELRWLESHGGPASNTPGSSRDGSVAAAAAASTSTSASDDGREHDKSRDGRPRPTYTHLYKKRRARRVPHVQSDVPVQPHLSRAHLPVGSSSTVRASAARGSSDSPDSKSSNKLSVLIPKASKQANHFSSRRYCHCSKHRHPVELKRVDG